MIFVEVAPIPGCMLGLEFPEDPVLVVFDLFILRVILWKVNPEDFEKAEKELKVQEKAP